MADVCRLTYDTSALQDGIWTAVQSQVQRRDADGPLLGAAQLARLVAVPGVQCASSLTAALQQIGQQVGCALL